LWERRSWTPSGGHPLTVITGMPLASPMTYGVGSSFHICSK
jgi:hypothetical protein